MSNSYPNYSQYLGAQRCCSIKTQGLLKFLVFWPQV